MLKGNYYSTLSMLFFAIILQSCTAFHSGMMTGNASISNGNFRVIKIASGTASTSKYFGIGGLNTDALVLEAKRDLYSYYPLKAGQALANVTVDFNNTYIFPPIYSKLTCTISADVVDFTLKPDSVILENVNNDFLFNNNDLRNVNESQFRYHEIAYIFKDNAVIEGNVLAADKEKLLFRYPIDGKSKSEYIDLDNIYTLDKNKFNSMYSIGDTKYEYIKLSGANIRSSVKCRVSYLGRNSIILQYQDNNKTMFLKKSK